MTCYYPIKAYRTTDGVVFSERRGTGDHLGDLELPCGQCIGCRMRRASDWAVRVMHEAQMHPRNCFVTLTYEPGKLPPHGSLSHEDFQRFMKRLRRRFRPPVRFYMCGEYGEGKGRAHYHACLFNVDFDDRVPAGTSASGQVFYTSALLSELWGLGIVSVQDLTPETASYCARYIMKKVLGKEATVAYRRVDPETGETFDLRPEYAAMSLKPGIGASWFKVYGGQLARNDWVVSNGERRQPPRYYDQLAARVWPERAEEMVFERQVRAKSPRARANTTDARLAVRDKVHRAKVRTLKRSL